MNRKKLLYAAVLLALVLGAIVFFALPKTKSPVAYGVELLRNGGFETVDEEGYPESWLPEAYFNYENITRFEITQGESGKGILITNHSLNDARYFQTVKVSPDTTYLFSGLIRAQAEGGRGANLSVADVYAFSEAVYQTDGAWQRIEFYGKTGRNQHYITLFARLGGYSGESTGTAAFDNLSLTAVEKAPEGVVVHNWEKQEYTGWDNGEVVLGKSKAPLLLLLCLLAAFLMVFLARREAGLEALSKDRVSERRARLFLLFLLLIALVSRLFVSVTYSGFPVDVNAFRAWANDMAQHGPSRFYLLEGHRDYPPGYMLVLWPLGVIGKLLGGVSELMIKLPSLLCDLGIIVLLYAAALKYVNRYAALLLSALYAFNPLTYLAGSAWGQVDSLPSLLLMIAVLFIQNRRWRYALPVYVLAVLMKPQALMVGPLGLLALIMDFVWNREQKPLKDVLYGALFSLALASALVLPFFNQENGFFWLMGLYGSTMSYYNFATVNATNLYFFFGKNWVVIENAAPFALRLTGALVILLPCAFYLYKNKEKLTAQNRTQPLLLSIAMLVSLASLLPMSLKAAGILYMASVFILAAAMYLKGQSPENLPLVAGILLAGFSVMGTMMHERYLFLAVALFTLAYVRKRDWRILLMLIAFTGLCFLNTGVALDRGIRVGGSAGNLDAPQAGLVSDSSWLEYALSALSLVSTSVSLYFGFGLSEKGAKALPLKQRANVSALPVQKRFAFARPLKQVRFDRKDAALILLVTGLYAIPAFVNLGALTAPQTPWVSKADRTEGDQQAEATLDLGAEKTFKLLFYAGVHYRDSVFEVGISSDGESYTFYPFQVKEGDLFNWRYLSHPYENAAGETVFDSLPREFIGRYVRISGATNQLTLMEVIAQDFDTGENLPFVSASAGAETLIDEQSAFSGTPSWFNSMYFDEIYHARTAYEQRNAILGIEPNVIYETSHPPLGKLLITFSVFIFGMTPFGWRFAGALAGVLMLPGVYLLGKQLTKKRWLGLFAAGLFALDFMHFTQTRIATIDSFSTLFIIYAYFFMLRYMSLDFVRSTLRRQLIPLFLSGLMMGLAIAGKWTGIYAGAGLAVLFFKTLCTNLVRSQAVRKAAGQGLLENAEDKDLIRRFGENGLRRAVLTCLWCLLFFVAIPAGIYYLSYIPVYLATPGGLTLEKVVRSNLSMFSYHSKPGFGADHPWASPWYSWPVIKKPMYYYSGGVKNGTASVIWAFGNPLVWWGGLAALILTFLTAIYSFIRVERMAQNPEDVSDGDFVYDRRPQFLIISFLAQYAPWILVPRGTYIYHYFPSVPFIVLCVTLMIDYLYQHHKKAAKLLSAGMAVLAALLFVAFFPYISGVRVSTAWLDAVRFIPNWLYY